MAADTRHGPSEVTRVGYPGTLEYLWRWPVIASVSDARARLSELLDVICRGERVTIARENVPIADLVLHRPAARRKLGLLPGRITVPGDPLDDDKEINEMFDGEERSCGPTAAA